MRRAFPLLLMSALTLYSCTRTSDVPADTVPALSHVMTINTDVAGMPGVINGEIVGTTLDGQGGFVPTRTTPFDRSALRVLNPAIRADGRAIAEYGGTVVAFDRDSSLVVQTAQGTRTVSLPREFWSLKHDVTAGTMSPFYSRLFVNGDLLIMPHPGGLAAYRFSDLAGTGDTPVWTVILEQRPGLNLLAERPDRTLRASAVDPVSGVTVYSWSHLGVNGHSPTYVTAVNREGRSLWTLEAVNPTEEERSRLVTVGAGEGIAAYQVTGQTRLRAVDIMTGSPLWEHPKVNCAVSNILKHIIIREKTVFPVTYGDSCVLALNLDGTQRWKHTDDGRTFAGVPAISQGVVYAANGRINALDLQTGQLLARSAAIRSTQLEQSTVVISPDGRYVAAWGDVLGVYRTLR